jgi:hypothetical protein
MKCDNPNCSGCENDNKDGILLFVLCKKCSENKPKNLSPSEYSRIEFGWTKKGFQIRCIRCNLNIMNFDLEGKKLKEIEGF